MTEIYHLPSIDKPTDEQVRYFLMKAAFYDEIMLQGGMSPEEASVARRQALARVGMGEIKHKGDLHE